MKTLFFSGNRDILSNFYRVEGGIEDPAFGVRWPTSEHAFMARKAELFGDLGALEALRAAPTPQKAKAIGRAVRNFDQKAWSARSQEAMREALRLKFGAGELEHYLISTGDAELVEASPWDNLWGIGMSAEHAARTPRHKWGRNWLGQALMDVRAERLAAQRGSEVLAAH